jgi:hypothetical protein
VDELHLVRTIIVKILAISFAIIVAIVVAIVTCQAVRSPDTNALGIGSFVILSLTLIVLVWYAYDTNSMARVTRERWMRDGVLSTTYSMELVGQKGQVGRTLFRIHNPSTLVVRARVGCNFCVYGDLVVADPLYDGKETWLLFPQQTSQGWFEIDSLLQKKGKSVAAMIAESTAVNRQEQLTMVLELEFWDELGTKRKLPGRRHYFDFDRWTWIPRLAEAQQS